MRPFDRSSPRWLASLAAAFLVSACGASEPPAVPPGPDALGDAADPLILYFRAEDPEALSQPRLATYPGLDPGESPRLDPGFPGAPPQIPHAVEDLLPITVHENACLDCHDPVGADPDAGDVPMPESHFTDPVIETGGEGSPQRTVVAGYEVSDEMSGLRFQCTICHVPQADNADTPRNTFGDGS